MAPVRPIATIPPAGLMLLDGWARIPVRSGQTVTGALFCAGVLATSRSLKYRRPRGPFCLRGDCGSCLVRINGRPNVRACQVEATPSMRVESQNRREQGVWEPSDWLDAWLGASLDHHHLALHPRWANQWMQSVARRLSGLGRIPEESPADAIAEPRHRHVRVVVVGGGSAGRAVARVLAHVTSDVEVLDRKDDGNGVFGIYPQEGQIACGTDGRGPMERLQTFTADHIVLATGSRASLPVFRGNDRPGVVSARGLAELLERERLALAGPTAVVGSTPDAAAYAERWNAPLFDASQVQQVEGTHAVQSLLLRDGRRFEASLVAVAEAPSASSDLARQAGASVRWSDRAGFIVQRDEDGRCPARGPWQLWACGSLCGTRNTEESRLDGRRVGEALAQQILAEDGRGGPHAEA